MIIVGVLHIPNNYTILKYQSDPKHGMKASPQQILQHYCSAIYTSDVYSFFTLIAPKFNPDTIPVAMKNRAKCKWAFSFASIIPSLILVFKNK
mmetsp:Transcript_22324/g.46426  ORF Transcript_22324/g.46426 Transcript_22324/m.46426 type:complete len:93 (-) Transcript_22324:900-1178(-)